MEQEALKIGLRGAFFFCLIALFCLRYHLRHIPYQLKSRCIEKVESMNGQVTGIRMNGRHVTIHGTVPDTMRIDSLARYLSSVPMLKSMDLNFKVPIDSIKQTIRRLSGRFIWFPKNSAEQPALYEDLLDSLANLFRLLPELRLTLRGWTDTE